MRNKVPPLADASTALRTGFAVARDTREIATEWSRYHQDVVPHTSDASQALVRVRTLKDMVEVQANFCAAPRSRSTTES